MTPDDLGELKSALSCLAAPEAETYNFCRLVELAGLDPTNDFIDADLRGTELAGLDLRGFDFRGADFRQANIVGTLFDSSKIIGAIFDDSDAPYDERAAISAKVRAVKAIARQEERLALLMNELLQDRRIGLQVLSQYGSDRARFASSALQYIRAQIESVRTEEIDELVLANTISWLYAEAYPMGRGVLLVSLAKFLARYPLINAAIKSKLAESAALAIEQHKDEIHGYLALWPEQALGVANPTINSILDRFLLSNSPKDVVRDVLGQLVSNLIQAEREIVLHKASLDLDFVKKEMFRDHLESQAQLQGELIDMATDYQNQIMEFSAEVAIQILERKKEILKRLEQNLLDGKISKEAHIEEVRKIDEDASLEMEGLHAKISLLLASYSRQIEQVLKHQYEQLAR